MGKHSSNDKSGDSNRSKRMGDGQPPKQGRGNINQKNIKEVKDGKGKWGKK
jgi:hypothetical protein